MNRFDKPYRQLPTYDIKKSLELFNLASKLDTHELLQFSLMNQLSLDVVNDNDECLLHEVISIDPRISTQHAKLNVIKFLIQNNVNPDKPNKFNKTPLHMACNLQLDLIVEYLLKIGANPNYADNNGMTPFHYLLTGHIKTIDRTTDIIDFVQPPKNKEVNNINNITEIKSLLWDIINTMETEPLLDTINKTLNNLLIEDEEIVAKQNKLLTIISEMAVQTEPTNILLKVKDEINMAKQIIKDKILKLFNRFPKLNFQINTTKADELSWSPIPNTTLIKNGMNKKIIKKEMETQLHEIEKINSDFKSINISNINGYTTNGFNETYIEYYKLLYPYLEKHTPDNRHKDIYVKYFAENFVDRSVNFEPINNVLRHKLAFDNASSIIDFKNLKYVGGPRNVSIKNRDNIGAYFNKFINLDSDNKKILYLLDIPINIDNINKDEDDIFEMLVGDILFNNNDFTNNSWEQDFIAMHDLFEFDTITPMQQNNDMLLLMKYFLVFVFTAIQHSDKFIELISIDNTIENINKVRNWYHLYNKNNIGSWIYGMWCDIMCIYSPSNLDCCVSSKFLMLIAGLNTTYTDNIQGCINAFKPQLIEYIVHKDDHDTSNIIKWILLLLNDNVTAEFYNILVKNELKYDMFDNITPNPKLNTLAKIIFKYIIKLDQIKDLETQLNEEEKNLYNSQKNKIGNKPVDIICKLIINIYNKLSNKPLKQTLLDTIYFIKNYNGLNITSIIEISTSYCTSDENHNIYDNDFDKNMQPSKYSIVNYIHNNNDINDINKHHLYIAHYLGLHYEGILDMIELPDVNLSLPDSLVPVYDMANNMPMDFHYFNGNDFPDNSIPLPLNYLMLSDHMLIPSNYKEHFYNINDRYFCLPTYHSYYMFLINKIHLYQNKIKNILANINNTVKNLLRGDMKGLKQLYLETYTSIVFYTKMLEYFINCLNSNPIPDSKIKEKISNQPRKLMSLFTNISTYPYKKLAKSLNKINSMFYLYYYLFSKEKLLILSKFNYYQLPTDIANSYMYYSNNNTQIANIMNEKDISYDTTGQNENIIDDTLHDKGFINDFSLGNYEEMFKEYSKNNFGTIFTIRNTDFKRNKSSQLPPSLYNSLDDFYKIVLTEIIKKIIKNINDNKSTSSIYNKTSEMVEKIIIKTANKDLAIYNILCKMIEEIIKDQINVYIENTVLKYYNKFYNNIIETRLDKKELGTQLFTTKEMAINLQKTKIDIGKILKIEQMHNLYLPIMKLDNMELFILYPNDLTNMNKLKIKYGLNINTNCIKILLDNNASPFITNLENASAIYPIIKNYNHEIIKELKKEGIDFRDFEGDLPSNFIKEENNNNINKILGNYNFKEPINKLLDNIDSNLYADIKARIISNEIFGNNVLLYLPESFHLSTYLTLQYLSEHFVNTNTEFTIIELYDVLNSIGINIDDINKNYLDENINLLEIPTNVNILITKQIHKENLAKLEEIKRKIKSYDDTIMILKTENKTKLSNKITESDDYKNLVSEKDSIEKNNNSILKLINDQSILGKINSNNSNIIERYKEMNDNSEPGLIMYAWSKLFTKPLNLNNMNYNLIPIYLLEKQQEHINILNIPSLTILKHITKSMSHLQKLCKYYFETNKYTDENIVLVFIKETIEYITEMVIGSGIEMMMRRILLTYFTESSPTNDISSMTERIDMILNSTITGKTVSMLEILYKDICPLLVKNSAEIFANRAEEQGHYPQSVREILTSYFQLLEVHNISPEILLIFKKDVVSYFDTFVSKTILLWYVNIENILKYFINNYRCLETLHALV